MWNRWYNNNNLEFCRIRIINTPYGIHSIISIEQMKRVRADWRVWNGLKLCCSLLFLPLYFNWRNCSFVNMSAGASALSWTWFQSCSFLNENLMWKKRKIKTWREKWEHFSYNLFSIFLSISSLCHHRCNVSSINCLLLFLYLRCVFFVLMSWFYYLLHVFCFALNLLRTMN